MSNNVTYFEDNADTTTINSSQSIQPTCTYIDNNTRLHSQWIIPLLSFIIMTTNVILSRWMIPSHIAIKKNHSSSNIHNTTTSNYNTGISKRNTNEDDIVITSSAHTNDKGNCSDTLIDTTTNYDENDDTETKSKTSSSISTTSSSSLPSPSTASLTPPNMCGIITNQSLMMMSNNNNNNNTKQQQIIIDNNNNEYYSMRYLNVNLSYELWKDIQFSFLQINYDNPNIILYIFRLLWRWQLFNIIVFIILRYIYTSIISM